MKSAARAPPTAMPAIAAAESDEEDEEDEESGGAEDVEVDEDGRADAVEVDEAVGEESKDQTTGLFFSLNSITKFPLLKPIVFLVQFGTISK